MNDNWISVISALLGTVLGYFLNFIKEYFEKRFQTIVSFRDGNATHRESNKISFQAYFDIVNKGHQTECVNEVLVQLLAVESDYQEYFRPTIELVIEHKDASNSVILIPPNQALTLKLSVQLEKDINNHLLFGNVEKALSYNAVACFKFLNRDKEITCDIPVFAIMEAS